MSLPFSRVQIASSLNAHIKLTRKNLTTTNPNYLFTKTPTQTKTTTKPPTKSKKALKNRHKQQKPNVATKMTKQKTPTLSKRALHVTRLFLDVDFVFIMFLCFAVVF